MVGESNEHERKSLLGITDAALKILKEGFDQDLEIFFITSWAI